MKEREAIVTLYLSSEVGPDLRHREWEQTSYRTQLHVEHMVGFTNAHAQIQIHTHTHTKPYTYTHYTYSK